MDRFSVNVAKSFLGKNVNLHLTDGSVIINVQLADIQKDEFKKRRSVTCIPFGRQNSFKVPLKNIAWAELLNLNMLMTSG